MCKSKRFHRLAGVHSHSARQTMTPAQESPQETCCRIVTQTGASAEASHAIRGFLEQFANCCKPEAHGQVAFFLKKKPPFNALKKST
jgi:hypothetical protein